MAQRKSPQAGKPAGKPGAQKGPAGPATKRPAGASARTTGTAPMRKPPKKGRSIVNQRQTPWGLIITAVVLVLFAGAIIGVVIATHKSGSSGTVSQGGQAVDKNDPYRQPELPAAAAIKGVTYHVEANHTHVEGAIKYDSTPPVGGDHSQYWADCTGTVYPNAIANENAVHMLEHGAIWVTYNANDVKGAQLKTLEGYVSGIDRMAMSPYPNLPWPISLQAWGYQLKVNSATDPRIAQFIAALKYNPKTTPEYGASCSQPTFKQHPSTFGHPLWLPANGSNGNTMP